MIIKTRVSIDLISYYDIQHRLEAGIVRAVGTSFYSDLLRINLHHRHQTQGLDTPGSHGARSQLESSKYALRLTQISPSQALNW
jgi:hypothetical protein